VRLSDLREDRRRSSCVRAVATVIAIGFLALAAPAAADVGIDLTVLKARSGGWLYATSNASGMPVYLIRSALSPAPWARCHGNGVCSPRTRRPPRAPFVRLGRVPGTSGEIARHTFRLRLPQVPAGRYRVFLYCRACGGSLLVSGQTLRGQTLTIL